MHVVWGCVSMVGRWDEESTDTGNDASASLTIASQLTALGGDTHFGTR